MTTTYDPIKCLDALVELGSVTRTEKDGYTYVHFRCGFMHDNHAFFGACHALNAERVGKATRFVTFRFIDSDEWREQRFAAACEEMGLDPQVVNAEALRYQNGNIAP